MPSEPSPALLAFTARCSDELYRHVARLTGEDAELHELLSEMAATGTRNMSRLLER